MDCVITPVRKQCGLAALLICIVIGARVMMGRRLGAYCIVVLNHIHGKTSQMHGPARRNWSFYCMLAVQYLYTRTSVPAILFNASVPAL
jgi:hypothetical protein